MSRSFLLMGKEDTGSGGSMNVFKFGNRARRMRSCFDVQLFGRTTMGLARKESKSQGIHTYISTTIKIACFNVNYITSYYDYHSTTQQSCKVQLIKY